MTGTIRRRAVVAAALLAALLPACRPAYAARMAPPSHPASAGTRATDDATAADDGGTDLSRAYAQWIDRSTVVWRIAATDTTTEELRYAPAGGIAVENGALTGGGRTLRLHPVPAASPPNRPPGSRT